jgi:TolB-like protein
MRKNTKALLVSVLWLALFFSGFELSLAYEKEIKALSSTLAESIVTSGKKSIAVVDFTDLQGNVTELGRFLAEEFSVALSELGKGFEVVDRTHLKSLLKEHQLAQTGLIDPQTARKLGEIAGVHALITGTITPFGDSIRLAVKVLDTSTAKVIGASRGDIAKTKALEELLAKGIETGARVTEGPAQTIPSPVKPKTLAKAEVEDFTFEGKECKRSGQRAMCSIAVTNNAQKTRRLYINAGYGQSILVDDRGNQYNPAGVVFGGKGALDQSSAADGDTPPSLPMNINIAYKDIHPDANYGNVILDCITDRGPFKAVLRNIPLSR